MKHKIYYFLLIVSLSLFISCNDDIDFDPVNEPLPMATTTGVNTFGFLLNDKTWLPYIEDKNKNALSVVMDSDSIIMFSVNLISDKVNRNETIKIFLNCNKQGSCIPSTFTFVDTKNILGCHVFDLRNSNLQFEITRLDYGAQIISGNFEIPGAVNSCGTESINITKGVFDCKFSK
jgi:hypothetical protein